MLQSETHPYLLLQTYSPHVWHMCHHVFQRTFQSHTPLNHSQQTIFGDSLHIWQPGMIAEQLCSRRHVATSIKRFINWTVATKTKTNLRGHSITCTGWFMTGSLQWHKCIFLYIYIYVYRLKLYIILIQLGSVTPRAHEIRFCDLFSCGYGSKWLDLPTLNMTNPFCTLILWETTNTP